MLLFFLLLPKEVLPIFSVRVNAGVLDLNRSMLDAVFAFQCFIDSENDAEGLNVRVNKYVCSQRIVVGRNRPEVHLMHIFNAFYLRDHRADFV